MCERIPQCDIGIHIVQIGIHQCQAMGLVYQFHTVERFVLLEICLTVSECIYIVMRIDIAVGCNHKAKSTAGRVKALVAQLGFDELRHHIDQHTRGEVLTGTGLLLIGVFLQESFIQVAQTFLFGLIPVQFVNLRDDFFEVFRLLDAGGCVGVNLCHAANGFFAQLAEQRIVVLFQVNAGTAGQRAPTICFRNILICTGLIGHFQKQNVGQLCHILVISNTVIPQHIAEVPKFLYNILRTHLSCSFVNISVDLADDLRKLPAKLLVKACETAIHLERRCLKGLGIEDALV